MSGESGAQLGWLRRIFNKLADLPAPQTNALTNTELREFPVAVSDDYASDVLSGDQTGTGDVLIFATGALKLVAVDVDPVSLTDTANYICRATVDGSTPTAIRGWRCRSGQTTYLPVPCASVVKVFAPAGVTVSVQGGAR